MFYFLFFCHWLSKTVTYSKSRIKGIIVREEIIRYGYIDIFRINSLFLCLKAKLPITTIHSETDRFNLNLLYLQRRCLIYIEGVFII